MTVFRNQKEHKNVVYILRSQFVQFKLSYSRTPGISFVMKKVERICNNIRRKQNHKDNCY